MTLEVSNLHVTFREFQLGPVEFNIEAGSLLALLGTNGSGKSTLLRSILGLQDLASGQIHWQGESLRPRSNRNFAYVGYVTDSSRDVLQEFTALEYWRYCLLAVQSARRIELPEAMERAIHYAQALDFPYSRRVPLAGLSLGTVRKAQIISALMMGPELLFLDEPFIGLDFIASRALEVVLGELRDAGTTIVVSNHDLDLASRLADKIVLLDRGQIVLNEEVVALGGHLKLETAITEALRQSRETGR